MDPDFERLLATTVARARDAAAQRFADEKAMMERQAAARGTSRTGYTYKLTLDIAASCVLELGQRLLADVTDVTRRTFGDLPTDLVQVLRQRIETSIDQLTNAFARSLGELLRTLRTESDIKPEKLFRAATAAKRDVEIFFRPLEIRARLFQPPSGDVDGDSKYDVFISHASEDKTDVAEPIALELRQRGFTVWLDKFELTIGDRLMSGIDEGLRLSRYGVVIVSHRFFQKNWTRAELNALAALEDAEGRKKILPVWHDVTQDDVSRYSPLLAAVLAVSTSEGISRICDEIEKVLRGPDRNR